MQKWIKLTDSKLQEFGFSLSPQCDRYTLYGLKYRVNYEGPYDYFPFLGIAKAENMVTLCFWHWTDHIPQKTDLFEYKGIGELKLYIPELIELIDLLELNKVSNSKEKSKVFEPILPKDFDQYKVDKVIQEQYTIKPTYLRQTNSSSDKFSILRLSYENGISIVLHEVENSNLETPKFDLDYHTIGKIELTPPAFEEFISLLKAFAIKIDSAMSSS